MMDENIVVSKRNILITGGSRGIGAEAVARFASLGDNVVFFYNKSKEAADAICEQHGATAIQCDVANSESVAEGMNQALRMFGGNIDILICNAGISDINLVTHIGTDRWKQVVDTNLNGMYYCINAVLPSMIELKSGNIITISSMWGQVGASCEVAYSASKAGVIGMTKALAKELGPSGIRVNCISPGMIDTEMNNELGPDVAKEIADDTPLERIGTKSDIVDAMEFLISEKSTFITGQVIGVNGGLVI